MVENVAETIRRISREHLEKNDGILIGQCLTAVGYVGGTVPEMTEEQGLIEVPTADVANGGFAVGMARAGSRPIYVVRYQGFQTFNSSEIINYAAKSKEMWGIPCPIFVRSVAMEGSIGPVASASHHGLYHRSPGVQIAAPMTPKEYQDTWDFFMEHDDTIYVSEHRRSFPVDYEMENVVQENSDITLLPISSTRLNAIEAKKKLEKGGVKINIIHLPWIRPFDLNNLELIEQSLTHSKYGGLITDGDYANGVAKPLAYDLHEKTGFEFRVLGLEERVSGFAPQFDVLAPTAERIVSKVLEIVGK
jgi:pyruvate/2-oxoglutarate/acetoin dehydrogenase E1 component